MDRLDQVWVRFESGLSSVGSGLSSAGQVWVGQVGFGLSPVRIGLIGFRRVRFGSGLKLIGSGWVWSDEGRVSLTWIVLLADLMSIDSASSRATIGAIIAAIWISRIIIKHAPYVPVRHLL